MKTCKTCKFWRDTVYNAANKTADCGYIGIWPEPKDKTTSVEIVVDVHDDSGLNVKLVTGENFGCVHHQEKQS